MSIDNFASKSFLLIGTSSGNASASRGSTIAVLSFSTDSGSVYELSNSGDLFVPKYGLTTTNNLYVTWSGDNKDTYINIRTLIIPFD